MKPGQISSRFFSGLAVLALVLVVVACSLYLVSRARQRTHILYGYFRAVLRAEVEARTPGESPLSPLEPTLFIVELERQAVLQGWSFMVAERNGDSWSIIGVSGSAPAADTAEIQALYIRFSSGLREVRYAMADHVVHSLHSIQKGEAERWPRFGGE
jgi:hypothetical protein